jgi:hypothetical protein
MAWAVRILLVTTAALLGGALWSGSAAAAPWCGSVSETERAAVVGGNRIRVVYAFPADGTDASTAVAPRIAAELDEVDAWWRREDSSRTLRFDVYADACGLQYDITKTRVASLSVGVSDNVQIFDAVTAELARLPGWEYTKYLVYYDGPATADICGTGGRRNGNVAMAVVFLQTCTDVGSAEVAVHELLHAFGLAWDAAPPHACTDDPGHLCDSSGDVLYPYAQHVSLSSFQLDVGHDDYYMHSGGWLDLQESPWLLRLGEQVPLSVAITGTGTVTSDMPGVACTASCTTHWNDRSAVTLSADPEPGQRFVRWGGACEGDADCLVTITGGATVTALFAPSTYRLAVTTIGRGTVRSQSGGRPTKTARGWAGSFTSYEPVKLVARAAKGWRLRGWAGSARGARATLMVPMTGDASVRAVFVRVKPKR